MIKNFVICFLFSLLVLYQNLPARGNPNKDKEKWVALFNGKDLNGWKIKITHHELNDNFNNTFRVEEGLLKVSYDKYDKFNGEFGHIFYKDKFSNYKIRVEYRFVGEKVPGGPEWGLFNSGVMIHSQSPESMGIDQNFPVSLEAQFLGDDGTGKRTTGNVCTPGTLIIMNRELKTEHCISTSSVAVLPEEWVTMEVEVHGDSIIRHFVNGKLVSEYGKTQLDENDPDAKKLIIDNDKILKDGYIALQAESHPIEFRKVEILILNN